MSLFQTWHIHPLVLFTPVIEECEFDSIGETSSFLCGDPQDLWKNGLYSKVPILMGNTEIEGAVVGLSIIVNNTLVNKFNSDFNNALQSILYFSGSSISENQRNLNKIVQIYFKNMSQLNSNNSFGLVDVRVL